MTKRIVDARWVILGGLVVGAVVACGDAEPIQSSHHEGGAGGQGGASGGQAGASAVIENPCGAVDESYAERDAEELFSVEKIPAFDLYLPESSWQWLNDHATDETYVEAQACFNGKAIGLVGLRFKGSYGSLYNCFDEAGKNTCRKLGMKVKFDEYVKTQRFYGLKRLNFQGYRYDDSYIKERLAYDVYRSMGIVTPRASWAKLRVNGEEQGLFGMVEQIDGRFTQDRWTDNGDGNLFKEAWPGRSDEAWSKSHLETNEAVADVKAFQAFSDAVSAASKSTVRATMGKYVDLKYWARFMAADDAVAAFDGVTTFYTGESSADAGNHNFFLYQESDKKFTIIPWDLESSMSLSSDYGNVSPWYIEPVDCTQTYPVWGGQGKVMAPGCDNVFRALAADMTEYQAAGRELLDGPFAVETMKKNVDSLAAFIRAEATTDPHGPGADNFEKGVGFIKQEIPRLRARLEHFMALGTTNPVVLDVAQVNGFETADNYGLTSGTMLLSNANTTVSVEVNETEPMVGGQSVRVSFDFGNETKAWEQWTFYSIPFSTNPADISKYTGIRFTMRSNVNRTVRVDLKSPNNSGGNSGIQVGWDVPVTSTAKVFEVVLANAKVPTWATDPKDDLVAILKTVTGLSFQPICNSRGSTGQLPDGISDQGYIDIDAIEVY